MNKYLLLVLPMGLYVASGRNPSGAVSDKMFVTFVGVERERERERARERGRGGRGERRACHLFTQQNNGHGEVQNMQI